MGENIVHQRAWGYSPSMQPTMRVIAQLTVAPHAPGVPGA